jgi:hypothetical protein
MSPMLEAASVTPVLLGTSHGKVPTNDCACVGLMMVKKITPAASRLRGCKHVET